MAGRWLAAAPPPDETWEYHAARQADPASFEAVLEIAEVRLELAGIRFAFTVDEERCQVDVTCVHPEIAVLPEGGRAQVTFLTLDWLLGEEAVELWVGAVDFAATHPSARPREDLVGAVTGLAERHRKPRWALLRGQRPDGSAVTALAQQPLKAPRWPRFDTHVAVTLPFRGVRDSGLPLDPSLDALRAFEDQLTTAVGDDGDLVAHETSAGTRTLHYYVDGDGPAGKALASAAPGWTEGRARTTTTYDPALDGVRHLRA